MVVLTVVFRQVFVFIVRLLVACMLLLQFAPTPAARHPHRASTAATHIVSRVTGDFNRDGRSDTMLIEFVSGRRTDDRESWCGAGSKYEGRFRVGVALAGEKAVYTDLNSLYPPGDGDLWFWAAPWHPVLEDYDADGRPLEFNLGQYAGCNNWRYAIFAIQPSGAVVRVAVEPEGTIPVAARDNSTRKITRTRTGISATWYDNSRTLMRRDYRWDAGRRGFVLESETPVAGTGRRPD